MLLSTILMVILFAISIVIGIVAFKAERKDMEAALEDKVCYSVELDCIFVAVKNDTGYTLEFGTYNFGMYCSLDDYNRLVSTNRIVEL